MLNQLFVYGGGSCPCYSQVIWGDVGDAHLDVLSALCADILLPLFFAQAKRGGLPKAAELTQSLQAFASDGARPADWVTMHALTLDFAMWHLACGLRASKDTSWVSCVQSSGQ